MASDNAYRAMVRAPRIGISIFCGSIFLKGRPFLCVCFILISLGSKLTLLIIKNTGFHYIPLVAATAPRCMLYIKSDIKKNQIFVPSAKPLTRE
jgi:hypothetical protein